MKKYLLIFLSVFSLFFLIDNVYAVTITEDYSFSDVYYMQGFGDDKYEKNTTNYNFGGFSSNFSAFSNFHAYYPYHGTGYDTYYNFGIQWSSKNWCNQGEISFSGYLVPQSTEQSRYMFSNPTKWILKLEIPENSFSSVCITSVSQDSSGVDMLKFYCTAPVTTLSSRSFKFLLKTNLDDPYQDGPAFWGIQKSSFNYSCEISTSDVINNQNENTQDIIDNQNKNQQQTNEKLDDLNKSLTDETENSDGTCKGVICNLKKVVKGIIDLPKNIINLMINALKSLFIPDNMDFINNFVNSIESKLGFIAEIPMSIINFTLNLANATWEDVTSISLPSIDIFGYKFWNAQEIDISEGLNIFKPFKYVTDCLCVALLSKGLFKCWENFTGGGKE